VRHSPLVDEDALDALVSVLDLVRYGDVTSRPELARRAGLGRNVVSQRVAALLEAELLEEAELRPSTGGRAPRGLRFNASAGRVLAIDVGATRASAAFTDLAGSVLGTQQRRIDVSDGPVTVLGQVTALVDQLRTTVKEDAPIWGVGVGVPGPVEFASGRPVSPPIMPGWDDYPVRTALAERYNAPVWVDNDVNIRALGEKRAGAARAERDVVVVKVGTGIGAGLISGGHLHRGAKGSAGDIGHVAVMPDSAILCRCGKRGCLEALAGGAAIARQGVQAAEEGHSPRLAAVLSEDRELSAADVGAAAAHGDPASVEILRKSAQLVGETVAGYVNFFNPSVIVLGGGVVASGDAYTAVIREVVYRRSTPLATRDLRIVRSPLGRDAGIVGAAVMAVDELFARDRLGIWLRNGGPVGRPELAELPHADVRT
jgi:glucokinase-like ROK family protein